MVNKDFLTYDEQNIDEVRVALAEEIASGLVLRKTYTMVQTNEPCEVEITEESRALCAEALLR